MNSQALSIVYEQEMKGFGEWKVYDIEVFFSVHGNGILEKRKNTFDIRTNITLTSINECQRGNDKTDISRKELTAVIPVPIQIQLAVNKKDEKDNGE
jgi:hypothetical protein